MAPLPRGRCPICGADVALRKGRLVREHRRLIPLDRHIAADRRSYTPICPGTGAEAPQEER